MAGPHRHKTRPSKKQITIRRSTRLQSGVTVGECKEPGCLSCSRISRIKITIQRLLPSTTRACKLGRIFVDSKRHKQGFDPEKRPARSLVLGENDEVREITHAWCIRMSGWNATSSRVNDECAVRRDAVGTFGVFICLLRSQRSLLLEISGPVGSVTDDGLVLASFASERARA